MLSSIGGGVTSIIISIVATRKCHVNFLIDGLLAALVSVTGAHFMAVTYRAGDAEWQKLALGEKWGRCIAIREANGAKAEDNGFPHTHRANFDEAYLSGSWTYSMALQGPLHAIIAIFNVLISSIFYQMNISAWYDNTSSEQLCVEPSWCISY